MLWNDIDLENKVIHIRNTISRVKNNISGGNTLIIDAPKTKASLRDVPIHSKLTPVIVQMKQRADSPFVVSNTKNFVSPRTYEYRYHRVLKQCKMDFYNYHTLRHTFATKRIIPGVDVKTLSEILGHSNVSITVILDLCPQFFKTLDFLKIMMYNIIKSRFSKSRFELTEVLICLLEERQN